VVRARAVVALLASCHPGPVVGVTLASAAYAVSFGRSASGVAAATVAVLAGQLAVGWHNDWIDVERDRLAGRPDKPAARGLVAPSTVGRAAVLALVATGPLSLLSGWRAGLVHLIAVAFAWAYNAGLKGTAASFVPYGVSFGLLPVFLALGAAGAPLGPWWAPVGAALLGLGAHFMNALPDLDDDLATGVRGLPHRLGRRRSLAGAAVLLLAASAVLALHERRPSALELAGLALAGLGVTGALVSARRPTSRAPFGLTIAVALLDVALLLLGGPAAR
jgi:4-hydroxybenzoate polyprenyltransferase